MLDRSRAGGTASIKKPDKVLLNAFNSQEESSWAQRSNFKGNVISKGNVYRPPHCSFLTRENHCNNCLPENKEDLIFRNRFVRTIVLFQTQYNRGQVLAMESDFLNTVCWGWYLGQSISNMNIFYQPAFSNVKSQVISQFFEHGMLNWCKSELISLITKIFYDLYHTKEKNMQEKEFRSMNMNIVLYSVSFWIQL